MKKFTITTLGCKVNQCESRTISQMMKSAGLQEAQGESGTFPAGSDFCVINTCTVTQKASMQSRQAVRQAVRSNPHARIIVTGCHAQTDPEQFRLIDGVNEIVGNPHKMTIPHRIVSAANASEPKSAWEEFEWRCPDTPAGGNRTRPVLKIQDGCNTFCTYCVVPYARGRSRSMPIKRVLDNIASFKHAGFRELVFSGVHLGTYGLDLVPASNLTELLKQIRDLSLIERARLSSIEPNEITDEIIDLIAQSAPRATEFCRHFHLPLQSGDDSILERMQRPYSTALFRERVEAIHRKIPDAAIGVDVLIGFPGENETAFGNTLRLIEDLPLTYLHVFPFSPRKQTPASRYSGQISSDIKKARSRKMIRLGHLKKDAFYRKFIGAEMEVLIEGQKGSKAKHLRGMTGNYIPILVEGDAALKNNFIKVTVEKVDDSGLVFGKI
jgi:threonylcarbamoyladenosine tRNA methylthiotransferase MtaB